MLFNSFTFAIFFITVFALYRILKRRLVAQNTLLLIASYVFYGWWDVRFLFLITLSTYIDYISALIIDRGELTTRQRITSSLYLMGSALLFVFFDYSALTISLVNVHIDPRALVTNHFGWIVFGATVVWSLASLPLYNFIVRLPEQRRRKTMVGFSVVLNLTILGIFKYYNFFAESLHTALEMTFGVGADWATLNIVLPVGISFYTFQTLSYTIDTYRKELRASKSLREYATYLAFFPQLVAGPIERGKHLLPQFRKARPELTSQDIREGTWLIFWGLYKKVVVADNMASIVHATFGPYDQLSIATAPDDGFRLLIAVYAFALQIYGDFSGYSDMARGLAKLMGFDIMLNFKLPYFATNPSEFWKRWHISLSSWLRDYLYIPLGGNRSGGARTYANLMTTMVLGGLWHGASWTFVLWGTFHGGLLCLYRAFKLPTENDRFSWSVKILLILIMFHFTCMGWLLFRAQNMTTVMLFLDGIFLHPGWSAQATEHMMLLVRYGWFFILFQILQGITDKLDLLQGRHWFIRLNVWVFLIMSIIALGHGGEQEFIYFAF